VSETPLEQWADAIEAAGPGRVVQVYRETASTQDHARRLIADRPSEADQAVIVAGHQTAGRGRLGRSWHSPAGTALTFSAVHLMNHRTLDRVAFAAAVAVAEALDITLASTPHQTAIKWPNDIYVGGRKIAGILVEVIDGFVVVGVGVNIHLQKSQIPDDLSDRATSLILLGAKADRLAVLQTILKLLQDCLNARPEQTLRDVWHAKCGVFERVVKLGHGDQIYEGRVVGLDPQKGLMLETGNGGLVHLPAATTTVLE